MMASPANKFAFDNFSLLSLPSPAYLFAPMYPVIIAKGASIRHTQDMRQENIKLMVTPVITAQAASKIDPSPSVETPFII
jgi:hypothetical protein